MLKNTLLLFAVLLLQACDRDSQQGAPEQVYPWQVDILADGSSRVFGIQPGISTLAEAGKRFNTTPELALFEKKERLSLEAYFSQVSLGGLSGKMVVILDVSHDQLNLLRQRAVKTRPVESGGMRHALTGEDVRAAFAYPIRSIDYIPYVNLDDETIHKRFGEPARIISRQDNLRHYLYPDKGLDLIQDKDGKEVLQYVAPARFNELLQPLLNAADQNK